ncbi:RNA polymerase sigma factor [Mesonia maritima]|uniref:RNA polymerase sigma-70 factor (ECF subfamily) n=1 Tax=Mesonia maritima TaxID=1793873 RepID=A0ABU1K9E7_9FLAO|nr:sigma-70 family RNA polymerase sigma factor [Mesonia maritima]MDR6302224.1 RNA polymerase sigma-70 factor (ECF subfamily) [Mesonia maritima]
MNSTELDVQIQEAKKGSQLAFKYLLDKYWSLVYNFQLKRTQNEYEAEEVTVQTFSKAFDKINNFNPEYKFSTWLISISKNVHVDLLRIKTIDTTRVDKVAEKNIADETPTAEDSLIIEQNLAKLLSLIKYLKPHYQEIIHLRFFQELSYKAIAETIDEPINNVKVKLLRAKKLLAEIIKENE